LSSELQITTRAQNHVLTNANVWSFDSSSIVYDGRSDAAGSQFDGTQIERVDVRTNEVVTLYESSDGACVGVVTCSPTDDRIVFIHGPEKPTPDWSYNAWHRDGTIVAGNKVMPLDARDIVVPFTPGALRGGSHVHMFDAAGDWISFTYEDHLLAQLDPDDPAHDGNQRNVGVSAPLRGVTVPHTHPRNRDGAYFTVLATRTTSRPIPGSDEIVKACEEGWINYQRPDGSRQRHALAFQGTVLAESGKPVVEVFIVELPDDLTIAGDGPLEGTATRRPAPPRGTVQRRLTFTADRQHPGLQGPRHWLRSSPDGGRIAFLMKDDAGNLQIWTVSPHGSEPTQVSRHPWDIASAFTWSPDGRSIAHVMDHSVFITDVATGEGRRLTPRTPDETSPRPEACVYSPDGNWIAFVRSLPAVNGRQNQIFIVPAVR